MVMARDWPKEGISRVPYWVYTGPEIYAREQERVFSGRSWAYVALEAEIPTGGDFKRSVIGDRAVVVVRDDADGIAVVENRCAHRGVQFCQPHLGHASEFICPYHQWRYNLQGDLLAAPFRHGIRKQGGMPADFDLKQHGLRKLQVARRHGVVFASFADDVEPLEDYLGLDIAVVCRAQDNLPGFPQPLSSEEPLTMRGPRNQPTVDLMNMKGQDRPTPLKSVTIEQKLDSQLPLDAPFRDENGQVKPLGAYFGKRPVILALVYYECPMLCTQILNGVVRAAKVLRFTPGTEYDVVAISFDARENSAQAAAKKAVYMKNYGHPEAAASWHFLTGDVDSVKRVTDSVGFRYSWDPHTGQFAHASAVYVLTPEGRLSKYFYGVDYSPKDLRLALVEASNNKIGNAVDQILLFCYHFDPHSAKYTPYALGLLRAAGGATVLMLGGFVFIMLRRESRQKGSRAA